MLSDIVVKDNFIPAEAYERVRQSPYLGGFNTWRPNKGEVGSSVYDGISFTGEHGILTHCLSQVVGRPVYPNSLFFRMTTKKTEKAYIHSDRESGDWTALVYLSDHDEKSGTGFYRNRRTGMMDMPSFVDMAKEPIEFARLKRQMVSGSTRDWQQTDFIRGLPNRLLLFRAPKFHSRCPRSGIGKSDNDGRLVWTCHFFLE